MAFERSIMGLKNGLKEHDDVYFSIETSIG
jgi:hypothetical protein